MEEIHLIINRKFGGYLRGQFILALSYGLLTYIIAMGFGLRYPVIIAVIAAVLMLIPFIGAFAAIVPPLVVFGAALLGGLWAGVSAGGRMLTCVLYCVPGLMTSFGVLFALHLYLGRTGGAVTLAELFIPVAVAAVLSLGLWLGTRGALRLIKTAFAPLAPSRTGGA